MITTSSTPTTLDRGVSSGTSATNTTASTRNSTSTSSNNCASTRSNNNNDDADDDEDVFIERTAAAQYDSMLAESIIRIRSQFHRDESSRASLTLSQNSAELFSSNEFDSSTISSAMTRPPLLSFISSAAITSTGDVPPDPDVATSSPAVTEPETTCDTKEKERAVLLSKAPQEQSQDEVSTIPDGLNTSMDLISKKRVIPIVQESSVPLGMTAQTVWRRNSHVDDGIGSHGNYNGVTPTDDMMYDSQHGLDTSHVNHVPIEAFSVPDVALPVQAIPISMGSADDDHDGNYNNSNDNRHDNYHRGADKLRKKKKMHSKSKRNNFMAILLLTLIASVIITAVLVGSICGSGAVTCRSSSSNNSNSNSETPKNSNSDSHQDDYDDRAVMINFYINNISFVSDDDLMANATSSNFSSSVMKDMATEWIIHSDPLQLNLTESEQGFFHIRQRYALAALWFHTSINDKWINSTGWLSGSHECNWYGIVCTEIDHGDDIGIQDTVIGLNMTSNNMNGRIPDDLAFLSNLQVMKFDFNAIYGTIPNSLGQCTDLELVELALNSPLTGTLPDSIGNWNKIIHFDISYNSFSGSIPSSLSNWLSIESFSASSNQFYSTLPSSLGLWTSVESFDLNLNRLYGTLPESIGNWPMIESFSVLGNNFSGTLPSTIGNWTNLYLLALSDNHFTGTIPNVFGSLENLDIIKFENNHFYGSVPEGLCVINITELIANCTVACDCCTSCY